METPIFVHYNHNHKIIIKTIFFDHVNIRIFSQLRDDGLLT